MALPLHPRGIPISELGLPPKLLERVCADDVIVDTFDLRCLHPDALRQEWKLTPAHFDRINKALEERGLRMIDMPTGVTPRVAGAAKVTGCTEKGYVAGTMCPWPRTKGKRKCGWHVLLGMPIEKQIVIADKRGEANRRREGHVERVRVPSDEWPPGARWCSECQGFIPFEYVTGTKCKAHASRAAHNTRLQAVYDITREQYEQLFAFQGGRCYICRNQTVKRLAVDHDHLTGAVRGLLCANDEWGCNVSLRRLLNSLDMAQRALEYVTMSPFDRMRSQMVDEPEEPTSPPVPPLDAWDPFGMKA
jgi:hypothetical protein